MLSNMATFLPQKSIYLVVFTFLYFTKLSYAFQDNFESDVIPTPNFTKVYDVPFVLNSPFTLCERDGVPHEHCDKVGLNLGGDTFDEFSVVANFDEEYEYNKATGMVSLQNLRRMVDRYYLPGFDYKKFTLPTEGQLTWLIDNELIPLLSTNQAYFYTSEISTEEGKPNTIGLAVVGADFQTVTNEQRKAHVFRLVTDAVPDVCKGGVCDLFRSQLAITLRNNRAICGTEDVAYTVSYQELDGNRKNFEVFATKTKNEVIFLSLGAKDVNLTARINPGFVAERNDIIGLDYDKFDGVTIKPGDENSIFYKTACYGILGTCDAFEIQHQRCVD